MRIGDLSLHLIAEFDDASKPKRKIRNYYVYVNQCIALEDRTYTGKDGQPKVLTNLPKMEGVLSSKLGSLYPYFKITKTQAKELMAKGFKVSAGF